MTDHRLAPRLDLRPDPRPDACTGLPSQPHASRRPRFALRPLALALAGGSLLSLWPGLTPNVQAQAVVPPVLPSGLTVIQGQVKAVTTGKNLTVTNSAGSILNWQSFSIGAGNGVTFVQPSAQSQVLNRVVGNDPSAILGSLSSNGRVWLLNPNGVIFGQGARIDVGGLVTSTLNLNDVDWLAGQSSGRFRLFGDGAASIVNQGELRSSLGGHIALLGGTIRNEGLIEAPGGQILLAAGKSVDLVDTGSPNLRLRVTAPDGEALNLGTLQAAGGRIDVHGAMVNQQKVIRADSFGTNAAGEIVLSASKALTLGAGSVTSASGNTGGSIGLDSGATGTTMVSGAVLATGSAGLGGQVTVLGKNVGLVDAARIDASGATGGGQIHVGGGERGQDPAFRNSDGVYVGEGASLSADATTQGDGGRIVLWADEATRAYGSFSARGGRLGGNGGFIETSGHWIDVSPKRLDASAPVGLAGTWLLDPYDIEIVAYGGNVNVGSGPTFTSTGPSATVTADAITGALNSGASVVIATGAGGTETGSISAYGIDLTVAPPSAVSLSLQAHGDITLSSTTIASTGAPLSVDLQAGRGSDGYLVVQFGSVTTAGGSFSATSPGPVVLSSNPIDTRGGSVTLRGSATGSVSAGVEVRFTPINAGTGTIILDGTMTNGTGSESGPPAGIRLSGDSSLVGGDVTLTGRATSRSGEMGVGIDLDGTGTQILASGNLSLTGTGEGNGLYAYGGLLRASSGTVALRGTATIGISNAETTPWGVGLSGTTVSGRVVTIDGVASSVTGRSEGIYLSGATVGATQTLGVTGRGDSYGVRADSGSTLNGGSGTVTVSADAIGTTGSGDTSQVGLDWSGGSIRGRDVSLTGQGVSAGSVGAAEGVSLDSTAVTATHSLSITGIGESYGVDLFAGSVSVQPISSDPTASLTINGTSQANAAHPASSTNYGVSIQSTYGGTIVSASYGGSVSITGNNNADGRVDFYGGALPASPSLYLTQAGISGANVSLSGNRSVQLASGSAVDATGPIRVSASAVTVNSALRSTAGGDAIVVAGAGGVGNTTSFSAYGGSLAASNGRWLVYGTTPASTDTSGLTYAFKQYNATYGSSTVLGTGNGVLYSFAPSVTVGGSLSRVYDGTLIAGPLSSAGLTVTGLQTGDRYTGVQTGAVGNYATKDVGTNKAVSFNSNALNFSDASGRAVYGYGVVDNVTGTVTRASIGAVTGITAANKTYDTTTAATLNSVAAGFSGRYGSDVLTVATATGAFADKNAGAGKAVNITGITLGGADAGNYTLASSTASTTASIARASIGAVTGITANTKVYDATTAATLNTGSAGFSGRQGSDVLTVATATGAFADKNVGTGKAVAVSGLSLGGSDAGNYTLASTTASATGSITPAAISAVTGITASNKTYDATTAATLATSSAGFTGRLASDVLTVATATGAFTDKNAGTGKTVNVTGLSLGGADAGNYTLSTTTASTTASIARASIGAVTGITANNKVYDATTAATLNTGSAGFSGRLGSDVLTVASASGAFADKNVGTGKAVSVSGLSLGGADVTNYTLASTTASASGNVTPAAITAVTGITANGKTYDATTAATLNTGSAGFSGRLGSDVLTVATASGAFTDKNAGTGKTVGVTGLTLGGADAGNYTLSNPTASSSANIAPAALTVRANDANKTYGTTLAFAGNEFSSAGLVGAESIGSVNLSSAGAPASASVAGGPYPIVPSNATGGSFSAANYNITYANGTLTVNPAGVNSVLASIVGNPTKTYDGSTLATLATSNYGLTGFVGSDSATVTKTSGSYDSANAGSRTVTTTLSNTDFAPVGSTDLRNYTLPTSAAGTGTIAAKTLTVTGVVATNKPYDGTSAATLSNPGTLNGLVAGQTLGLGNTGASFDTKDAGTGKAVTVSGLALTDGSGLASNYTLASTTARTTANVTPAALTVTANDAAKSYGSTVVFSGTEFTSAGLVGTETVGRVDLSSTGAPASASVAGGPYPIVASNAGGGSFSAANYTIRYVNGTLTVRPADLNAVMASIVGDPTKTYDGSTVATLTSSNFGLTGFIGSDAASVTQTIGRYASADAGSRSVTADLARNDFAPQGSTDLRNYNLPTTATGAGTITPKAVTLVGVAADNKTYDGTVAASLGNTGTLVGLVGSQTLTTSNTGARFDTKDAGTGKTVTVGGIALTDGTGSAANYRIAPTATSTADITPKTVTLASLSAADKVYDGNTRANLTLGALGGLVGAETLSIASSGNFDTQDVGTGKTVVIGLALADGGNGGLAGNYRIAPSATTTADITPKTLTFDSIVASSKVYDGTAVASVTLGPLRGLVGTETLSVVNGAARFDSKDVGNAKSVVVSGLGLGDGTGRASNYQLAAATGSASADIAPAPLTITANNAAKTFGSTLTFAGTEFTSTALAGTETLTSVALGSPGAAATASVAGGPYAITPSNAAGTGFDARNYNVRYVDGSLTVNPANLSAVMVDVIGNPTKSYDGSTLATLGAANFGLSGFIGSDAASVTQTSGRYDSANAGSRTVTVNLARSDYAPAGSTDLRNYALPVVASGAGTIVPKALTPTEVVAANKVYDGNTAAAVTIGSLAGLVGRETLVVGSGSASFDSRDAGTGKTVTVTGLSLSNGTGLASNYTLGASSARTSADITPAPLTVIANDAAKTYGSIVNFVGNEFTSNGLVGGETIGSIQLTSTGAAASASVAGGPYPIVASQAGGGSFSAANYRIAYVDGSLRVDPAALSLVLAGIVGNPTKVYDGNTVATLSSANFSLSGFVGTDAASVNPTVGRYDSADAGSRNVSADLGRSDFSPRGATDLRNYTLPTTASGAGTITPKTVTLAGLTASDKVYDGNLAATLSNAGTLVGLIGSQTLVASSGGARFDTKDAGSGKTVTVSGIGLGDGSGLAANYRIAPSVTTTAAITPKTLVANGVSAASKVYDGNTAASTNLGGLSGLVGAETLATTVSGSFDNKNVGTAKTVGVGIALADGSNGGLAANYRIAPASTTADITPATLVYTAQPADKLVGAPVPALSGSVSGFIGGESLVTATTGSLGFRTPATPNSPAGAYAVDGTGLAAQNYRFSQAASNATALTVTGLEPQQTEEGSSKAALSLSLASVIPTMVTSSPAEGRVLDAIQAISASVLGQVVLFRPIPVGNMSMDSLSALLTSRDRYKKALFAQAIHQLEVDPGLADAKPCQTAAEVESGTCVITDALLVEMRAARLAQVAAAGSPPTGVPSPGPAAAPTNPQTGTPPAGTVATPPPAPVPLPEVLRLLRRTVRTAALPQIERKIAVVIGTNQYADKSIPQLANAVGDARAIGQMLESSLGYETIVLANATKQTIVRTLNRLAIDVGPRDSVVVYYAGHGELVESTGLGYWQLADSEAKRPETWLSNADISRLIRQIGASQVALISDSCYSGSLVDERIQALGRQVDPQALLGRKTVVVMSSGGNEPVFDEGKEGHSPFAYSLMNNLRQLTNWQVGGNVFERVRFAVARELPQRPHYGSASAAGHQAGGDYLFEQRQLDASP